VQLFSVAVSCIYTITRVFAKRTFQLKLQPFKGAVVGVLPPEDSRPQGCYAKQEVH